MGTKKTKQENNPTNDEVARLKQLHENQAKTIEGLIAERNDKIKELKGDVAVAEANLEYYKSLPWYKKIFMR